MNAANQALLKRIRELKSAHPAWGYRRVWAYLTRRLGVKVNHKRVYRLMKLHKLTVPPRSRLRASRTPTRNKPRSVVPDTYWGIDMTKVMLPTGWAYLHVVLDWGSKKLLACTLSRTSRAGDWIDALDEAVAGQFPQGIREVEDPPDLVSDHGSQPTSRAFKEACETLGIRQIFASYCNPKGNADTERVIRTIKEDLVWPREHRGFDQFQRELREWVHQYNHDYPHSALGYDTPYQYEQWFRAATGAA
jgi:transposase InsO family protein